MINKRDPNVIKRTQKMSSTTFTTNSTGELAQTGNSRAISISEQRFEQLKIQEHDLLQSGPGGRQGTSNAHSRKQTCRMMTYVVV